MQQDNKIDKKYLVYLNKIEDIVVSILLLGIMLFAVVQIIFRNIFEGGFVWGDSLLRILVLWLGLAGAILASRKDKQISIDILTQFIAKKYRVYIDKVNAIFAAAICFIISYYSLMFVILEYEDSIKAFEQVPAWITESIIPFGFAVMGLKYLAKLLQTSKL